MLQVFVDLISVACDIIHQKYAFSFDSRITNIASYSGHDGWYSFSRNVAMALYHNIGIFMTVFNI